MTGLIDRLFRRTPGPTGKNDPGDPDSPVKTPATPGSVGGSNESKAKLAASLAKVDAMISQGKSAGRVLAAANLQHWRDGSGSTRIMPASAFSNESFINEWLIKEVWPKFTTGTEKRLKAGSFKKNGQVEMNYESARGLYAPFGSDLFFAIGGFTVRSDVVVKWVDHGDGGAIFEFTSWKCKATDTYNWDPGKSTWVPGMGTITDDELNDLEKAGYGKAFNIESETWQVTDPKVLRAFSVSGF